MAFWSVCIQQAPPRAADVMEAPWACPWQRSKEAPLKFLEESPVPPQSRKFQMLALVPVCAGWRPERNGGGVLRGRTVIHWP